jgi:hypothetical protein
VEVAQSKLEKLTEGQPLFPSAHLHANVSDNSIIAKLLCMQKTSRSIEKQPLRQMFVSLASLACTFRREKDA